MSLDYSKFVTLSFNTNYVILHYNYDSTAIVCLFLIDPSF